MGGALHDAGMPPLASRVFSALLVDDDGSMGAAELMATLAASAGGVSGAVRYLESTGLLFRDRVTGDRHDLYVVRDDAWREAMMSTDTTYRPMITALEQALAGLASGHPARHRLDLSREFLVFVAAEINAMTLRWDRHRRRYLSERERAQREQAWR